MWIGLAFRGVMAVATTWWVFDTGKRFADADAEERQFARDHPLQWLGSDLLDKTAKTALIPILTILMYLGYGFQRTLISGADIAYRKIVEVEEEIEYTSTFLGYPSVWIHHGHTYDTEQRFFVGTNFGEWAFTLIDATLASAQNLTSWDLSKGRAQWNDYLDTKFRMNRRVDQAGVAGLINTDDELWVGINLHSSYAGWNTTPSNRQVYANDIAVGDRYFARGGYDLVQMISGARRWSFKKETGDVNNTTSEQAGNHPIDLNIFDTSDFNQDWEIVGCSGLPWIRFQRGTASGGYYHDLGDLSFAVRFEHWNVAEGVTA
jgi:hypothetical protein